MEIFNINIHSYFFGLHIQIFGGNIQYKYSLLFFFNAISKYLVQIFKTNIQFFFASNIERFGKNIQYKYSLLFFFNAICKYSVQIFNRNIQFIFFWMKVSNIRCKYSTKLYHYIQRYFPHKIFIYSLQIFGMTIVIFSFYAINYICRAHIKLSVTCYILIQ